jgi:glycosyltransferase involved in cell wall biosynthesis
MNDKPLVSILVLTYNRKVFLHETIESILNQTYKNFEIIIVDNFSNYDFLSYMNSFKDDRIKPFQNKNNGVIVVNRNYGLTKAQGEYIAVCDDDDLWIPQKLEKQVNYLNYNHDIAALGCQYSCINENGNPLNEMHWPVGFKNNIFSLITGFSPVGHPGVLIRKKVLNKVGNYDSRYPPAEDYELWLRLVVNGYKLDNLDEFLIKYRIHQSQTSTLQRKLLRKNHILAFNFFYHLMVGMQLTTNDLIEYFNIFKFKAKVKQNNISKIFTIYFSLLTSINKIYYLDRDIKSVLHQQFFNAIGKNVDDVSFFNIISEAINHRVLGLDVKRQLWAIYKARLQSSEK